MALLERMREISEVIEAAAMTYGNEYDLQSEIHAALELAGFDVKRELVLSEGSPNRIDLYVEQHDWWLQPGIGVEVKIDGAGAAVTRQLTRYAGENVIAGLLLVTTRSKHHHIPHEINGKPVRLVSLIGHGL